MKLKKLKLENFRSYKTHEYLFELDKNCTILVGPNGKGKTNFLEAIYVLSLGRSFRTKNHDPLIEWGSDYLRCQGELEIDEESTDLEVFYSHQPRRHKGFKKNGVKLKNSEYIGNLLTVLFHPEDLNLLYLSPALRRKYLDTVLSQTDRHYLQSLSQYNKVLKQRNALLKQIREGQNLDLDLWDQQLIEYGISLTIKRLEFIASIQKEIQDIYQSISRQNENIKIAYQAKFATVESEPELLAELFQAALNERRPRDIRQGQSTAGPHRDDIIFHINDHLISLAASRGEFRTLLLAIKLAEISYIKAKTGQMPILLLDDVFSELDAGRQHHLLDAIKTCQTIITTTSLSEVGELAEESSIVTLANW